MKLKRYSLPILLIIVILAVALRIWGITSESYWLDEAVSIKQAQEDYFTSIEMVKKDIHMPLYITVLHFWIKVFGISELSSRFLSLMFGVLAVGIMYLLAKKLFSVEVATIAALLMCVSPIMIYYSQEARLYSLFVLQTLLSFYFFIRYLEKKDYTNLIAYVFFSLLLMYTHLFSFLVLLIQNMYMLYVNKFKIRSLLRWFSSQFVLFILFIPWLSILLRQITNSALNTMWISTPNRSILVFTLFDFFGNYLILAIFIIMIITFILTKKFTTVDKNKLMLLSLWMLLPFLSILMYSLLFSSIYTTRYLLFTLPAFYLLFAVIINAVLQRKKFISWIIVCVLITSSFISVVDQVNRADKDDWSAVSDYIKQNVKKDDFIFINPFYHQDPFTYYYDVDCFKEFYTPSCNFNKHRILSMDWIAECCSDTTKLTATDGKNELSYYVDRSIWLMSIRPELYDVNNSLFNYFNKRKKLTGYKEIGEIKIYKFE